MEIKGVIHVHSTYSYDGKESLQELKDFLLSKEITFCCLTEHTDHMTVEQAQMFVQECRSLSGSQFVFIPGFEVPYKDTHILFIGNELLLGQHADESDLPEWKKRSALTILAHPVRNKYIVDAALRNVIDGVEIWNQQYDGKRVPRTKAAELLRELQTQNQSLIATGGLDFHRKEHFGAPFLTLEVTHITTDAILEALKNHTFVFGTPKIRVAPTGLWKGSGSVVHNVLSFVSIAVINAGKFLNKLFAHFGISFPKGLKHFIRSRI
jgi:hypothetical protein